jgi:hypothetical protein
MVYATTGEKVAILFRVGEAFTGSVVGAKEGVREIRADLAAAERIAKIELVRNGEVIDSEGFSSENVSYTFAEGADWSSVEPIASPSGEKLVYYYIRVSLAGGGMAWSSPVWLVLQAG